MKIKVVYARPNFLPIERELENDMRTYQDYLDGKVASVIVAKDTAALYNPKGEELGMNVNFSIGYTTLYGPVIFVGVSENDTEYKSLSKYQIEEALAIVRESRNTQHGKYQYDK